MQLCFAKLVDIYVWLILMIFICTIHTPQWQLGVDVFFQKIVFSYILQIQTNCKICKTIKLSSEIRLFFLICIFICQAKITESLH